MPIEIIKVNNQEVHITSARSKQTDIERDNFFTSTSGGYWHGKIIECVDFDQKGLIYGYVALDDEPRDNKHRHCLCGGDAFVHLTKIRNMKKKR